MQKSLSPFMNKSKDEFAVDFGLNSELNIRKKKRFVTLEKIDKKLF